MSALVSDLGKANSNGTRVTKYKRSSSLSPNLDGHVTCMMVLTFQSKLDSFLLMFQFALQHSLTSKAFSELLQLLGAKQASSV